MPQGTGKMQSAPAWNLQRFGFKKKQLKLGIGSLQQYVIYIHHLCVFKIVLLLITKKID